MDVDTLTEVCLEKKRELDKMRDNCTTKTEYDTCYKESLDRYRNDLEAYIWQHLLFNYGSKLDEFWKTHKFPKKSARAWVIVERRCHPNWWFVLRNIAWAAPDFSLYIYCSNDNYTFIRSLLGDKADTVHIIKWFESNVSRQTGKDEYAITFKLPGFYKLIDAEYLIRVEMDTYVRHKIPDNIFVGDYYGSPWMWNKDEPGGGGLVIRKIRAMIEMLTNENTANTEADDFFIGNLIKTHGYTYPPYDFRKNVFSENFPVPDPIGVHQFWTFIDNFDIQDVDKFKSHLARYLTIHIV
jgi:hypothetical protein